MDRSCRVHWRLHWWYRRGRSIDLGTLGERFTYYRMPETTPEDEFVACVVSDEHAGHLGEIRAKRAALVRVLLRRLGAANGVPTPGHRRTGASRHLRDSALHADPRCSPTATRGHRDGPGYRRSTAFTASSDTSSGAHGDGHSGGRQMAALRRWRSRNDSGGTWPSATSSRSRVTMQHPPLPPTFGSRNACSPPSPRPRCSRCGRPRRSLPRALDSELLAQGPMVGGHI